MSGIPELERCHQEFLKYVGNPIHGQKEIVATQAFLPYLKALCHIFDEQEIPYFPLPNPRGQVALDRVAREFY